MPDAIPAAYAAIIGAAIGGFTSVISILIGKFFDDRREARQLAIQAGIEAWKVDVERAKITGAFVWDVDTYIMNFVGITRITQRWFLSEDRYRKALREHFARNRILGEEINRIRNEKRA